MFGNGQGDIFDENGREAMDWKEEVNPYNTETLNPQLSDRMDQLERTIKVNTTPKNKYADYSDN
ncbi:hypothetical protein INT47_006554 [Mucor saturninus]|uniref:Uncharacterized protein n=1 Tax=Mucor saturninus TaxID=64648 RepID=A0A8H7QZB3_9FUNG|nr:hypothetical protein INT47_006554 [Mucor saturninus]